MRDCDLIGCYPGRPPSVTQSLRAGLATETATPSSDRGIRRCQTRAPPTTAVSSSYWAMRTSVRRSKYLPSRPNCHALLTPSISRTVTPFLPSFQRDLSPDPLRSESLGAVRSQWMVRIPIRSRLMSRRCRYCQRVFQPCRYHPQQLVCSRPDCQRQRRREYHRRFCVRLFIFPHVLPPARGHGRDGHGASNRVIAPTACTTMPAT